MNKVLVIGACGFVGSNFVRKAIHNKYPYHLVGMDRISYPNSIANIYQHSKYQFYLNDFSDSHALRLILEIEQPDKILFAAKPTYTEPFTERDADFFDVHLKLFQKTISEYQSKIADKIKVIYLLDDEFKYTHHNIFQPQNALLLLPEVFGPRQNKRGRVANFIFTAAQKHQQFVTESDSRWIFIDDLCSAINYLFQDWKEDRKLILDSGWNLSYSEMAEEVGFLLNDLSWIKKTEADKFSQCVLSTDDWENFSWPAQRKFKECLTQTVEWYQKNSWFLKGF